MPANWLAGYLYEASQLSAERLLVDAGGSRLSGALVSPDASRLCVPEGVSFPHRGGGMVAQAGTELRWLQATTFEVVLPAGADWLRPNAGAFEPRDMGSAPGPGPPSLTFCEQQPVATSLSRPPGELVRLRRQPLEVSAEAGKLAVLRITPAAETPLEAVVVAREAGVAHVVWAYRSIVVDGWLSNSAIAAVVGRIEAPPKKQLGDQGAGVLVGRPAEGDAEGQGWILSKEGKRLFRWPSVSPNHYAPGDGKSLGVLVCVGAFPFVIESNEYWSFGFSSSWGGPRFDYEILGPAVDGVVPVRLADAGANRPAERMAPLEPSPSWPNEPVRPAIDPRAVLDEGAQHYVRVSDLFRCGYHERARPGARWHERAALPDGTPVGAAAAIPPATCPDNFDGERGSEWGFVFP